MSREDLFDDPNYPGLKVCLDDLDNLDPWRLAPRSADVLAMEWVRPDFAIDGHGAQTDWTFSQTAYITSTIYTGDTVIQVSNGLMLSPGSVLTVPLNNNGSYEAAVIANSLQSITVFPGAPPAPASQRFSPALFDGSGTSLSVLAGTGPFALRGPAILVVSDGSLGLALINDGGIVELPTGVGYPTSFTGLPIGAFYNDGLAVGIAGPTTPNPHAAPLFFANFNEATLLIANGANLPTTDPVVLGQLWNNGGLLCVSFGT